MCDDCTAKIAKLPKDVQAMCVAARLEGKMPHLVSTGGKPLWSAEERKEMFYVFAWHDCSEDWHDKYELVSVWHHEAATSGVELKWVSLDHTS